MKQKNHKSIKLFESFEDNESSFISLVIFSKLSYFWDDANPYEKKCSKFFSWDLNKSTSPNFILDFIKFDADNLLADSD